MKVILFSSILYLTGVVAILLLKPQLMFTEDGRWKEFGLVADPKYTWFPFWLFCIVWALLSYTMARTLIGETSASSTQRMVQPFQAPPTKNNLKSGYYILNREASEIEGVPRYVYVGAEEPSD